MRKRAITNADYVHDDITFCASDCANIRCHRHPANIKLPNIPHSFADLKDTDLCKGAFTNMTLELTAADYYKAQRSLAKIINKRDVRESLRYICVTVIDPMTVELVSCNGDMLIRHRIPAIIATTGDTFLMPVIDIPKTAVGIKFTVTAGTIDIVFTCSDGKQQVSFERYQGTYMDYNKVCPDTPPAGCAWVNPRYLSAALEAFSGSDAVKLEVRDAVKAITIESATAKAIVLPVRHKE